MRNRYEMPPALTKALRQYVANALIQHGDLSKRVSPDTANAYIDRAIEKAGVENLASAHTDAAVLALLCPVIIALVNDDERAIAEIVQNTIWPKMFKLIVRVSIKRHGVCVDEFGKDAEDYCFEAVQLLLNRRRHYPYYKGLELSKFLVRTADNLRDHARKLAARQGQRLAIVPQHPGPPAFDECFEERLASPLRSCEVQLIAKAELASFLASLKDPALRAYAEHRAVNPGASAKNDAEELGIAVKRVYQLRRRLARRVASWNRGNEAKAAVSR